MITLLLFACGTDDSKDGISVDVPTTSQFSVDDFENVNCQDVTGTPANGASAYYVGNFALNGNSLDGIESAFFIASETLSENSDWEEGYCEMHWAVSGETTDPEACANCDIAFDLQGSLIAADSNCPDELQDDFQSVELFYSVQLSDDGAATWYMRSGTYLGIGEHDDSGLMTYVSEEDCKWF
jgi:hypothetical protein